MEPVSVNPLMFIEETRVILDQLDECRKEKSRLQGEVKQLEKAAASLDKSISDAINTAQRRRKEDIAAGYDEQLGVCQNQIKDCRAERAKARADAVAEKIQRENSHLEHENTEIDQQITQLYEENSVKSVFKKHWLVILFYPKRIQDWLFVSAAAIALLFVVPLFLILGMQNQPLTLACTLFVYLCCVFSGYLYVLHRFMFTHQQVHLQAEELKARLKDNTKTMNNTAANIRKSQDETGYNLGGFDDRIAEIETQMRTILAERKAALDHFEEVIRQEVTEEIIEVNAEQKNELTSQLEEAKKQLADRTQELEKLESEVTNTYEARLGKDLMYRQKLAGLESFCRENPELGLEQAIDCYRSTKK